MSWFLYAIFAALFTSAASLTEKNILFREHAMEYSAAIAVVNAAITLPFFLFIDYSRIALVPYAILFLMTIVAATAFLLVAKAMRHMEISTVSPFLALTPGVIAVLGFLLLGEALTVLQTSGIGLLLGGVYVLQMRPEQHIFDPFKNVFRSTYHRYLALALFLYSITAIIDRYLLSRFDIEPAAYLAIAHLFVALHFLILIKLFHDGFRGIAHGFSNAGSWIVLTAVFITGYRLLQLMAVQIAFAGLVASVKRLSVLFTTIIGGELFHEQRLLRKTIAAVIILSGVVLVII